MAEAADQRRRNLLRKELAWLRRGPPARTSKPKFRIEAATALIDGEPAPRDGVELSRLATARLGRTVLEIEDVTVLALGGTTPLHPPAAEQAPRAVLAGPRRPRAGPGRCRPGWWPVSACGATGGGPPWPSCPAASAGGCS